MSGTLLTVLLRSVLLTATSIILNFRINTTYFFLLSHVNNIQILLNIMSIYNNVDT